MTTITAETSEQLEVLLADLLRVHEELLALAAEHRAALSRADGNAVYACAQRHAAIAQRIESLESTRRRMISALAPAVPAPTISSVALHLPQAARDRIMEAAGRLRALMLRVQHELRTLRAATQALVGHMDGIMQQVARVLSTAGTYGRNGRIESTQPLPAGIDLRQ
jgi:hypothetical protein